MATKKCHDCGQEKQTADFYAHPQTADRLRPYCRSCASRRAKERYRRRSAGATEDRRVKYQVPEGMKRCSCCGEVKDLVDFPRHKSRPGGRHLHCKPCHNAQTRASRDRAGGARRYHLNARYGVDPQAVSAQMALRRGLCAICREAPGVQVDHDHATGRPRGMLCFNCNGGLGQFKDDPVRLARAIDYSKGARWTTALEAPGVYRLCS